MMTFISFSFSWAEKYTNIFFQSSMVDIVKICRWPLQLCCGVKHRAHYTPNSSSIPPLVTTVYCQSHRCEVSPGDVLYQAGAGKVTVFTPGCTQVQTGYLGGLASYSVHIKATWGRFWKAPKNPETTRTGIYWFPFDSWVKMLQKIQCGLSYITYFVNLTKY